MKDDTIIGLAFLAALTIITLAGFIISYLEDRNNKY